MSTFQYNMTDEQKAKMKADLNAAVAKLTPEQLEEMRNPKPFIAIGVRINPSSADSSPKPSATS